MKLSLVKQYKKNKVAFTEEAEKYKRITNEAKKPQKPILPKEIPLAD